MYMQTVSQKYVISLYCCNCNCNTAAHEPMFVTFCRNVTEKVRNQKMVYFPPHLTNVFALPNRWTHGNCIYHVITAWSESQWTVFLKYLTTLAIKTCQNCISNNNLVCWQDSTQVHLPVKAQLFNCCRVKP